MPTAALITSPPLSLAIYLTGPQIYISLPGLVRLPTAHGLSVFPGSMCIKMQLLPGFFDNNEPSQGCGFIHPWTLVLPCQTNYVCCFFLSMAESIGDVHFLWLMRCHTDRMILLFKDSDALHLPPYASILFHVTTDNEALVTSSGPITTTTWWIHGL